LGHGLNDDQCQELGHYTAESFCSARRHPLGDGIYWSPGLPDDVKAVIVALLSLGHPRSIVFEAFQ
jgi:hypothetical protein